MSGPVQSDPARDFEPLRPRLVRIAYRMTGSVADAEDAVQEAFLRWNGADRSAVREPEAFLRRTVIRLCLDQLKSARSRRETYVGPWLPEPVIEEEEEVDVTLPLMLALERLSPLERASFLLHDVFDVSFDEVGTILQRSPAACRQLATRARLHLHEARPRFRVERRKGLAIAEAFFAASRSGDLERLGAMLTEDVVLQADGGGRRPSVTRPVEGFDEVMRIQASLAKMFQKHGSELVRTVFINGLPGIVTREADGELQTTALEIEDGKIATIYVMRNPDKLRHLH